MNLVETIRNAVQGDVTFRVDSGEVIVKNGGGDDYVVESVYVLTPSDTQMAPFVIPAEDFTDEVRNLVTAQEV